MRSLPHRLAQDGLAGLEVEHIVDELEGHAHVPAVGSEALLGLFGRVGHQRSHKAAGRQQAGGLAMDELVILLFSDVNTAYQLGL